MGVDPRVAPVTEFARRGQVRVEALLARLYTDAAARDAGAPTPTEKAGGRLDAAGLAALRHLDRPGLDLMAVSLGHKRAAQRR